MEVERIARIECSIDHLHDCIERIDRESKEYRTSMLSSMGMVQRSVSGLTRKMDEMDVRRQVILQLQQRARDRNNRIMKISAWCVAICAGGFTLATKIKGYWSH